VRQGLPFAAFETLVAALGLAASELSRVLYIPDRTLARRRAVKQLPPDESDRVVRAARVFLQAQSVFATQHAAAEWLKRPNRALGNEVPLTLLDTDMGAREVEGVINRIRYGIYS
jgi:putative toxin-antitoxin system antitoxin component (TIGR02293 family)